MPTTNWPAIAAGLVAECPSDSLRGATIDVLSRVELLGPPIQQPADEFRRVYESLRWNQADRILQIVNMLLPRTKGPDPKLIVRLDAWGYVIGVLDEWIVQARIFYLVSGILETTLRARLDARLTDTYGSEWPKEPGVVPSVLHEVTTREQRDEQLARVHRLATDVETGQLPTNHLLPSLTAILEEKPIVHTTTSAQFVRGLNFHALRTFFGTKRLYEGKANLQELFRGRDGKGPKIQRQDLVSSLIVLNDARNDISHYYPRKYLSFEKPLFEAARLTKWLGQNLQHIYESIDTRHTTELSVVLAPVADYAGWTARPDGHRCAEDGCETKVPFDWLLSSAPTAPEELRTMPTKRACLYHRVAWRNAVHRRRNTPPAAATGAHGM